MNKERLERVKKATRLHLAMEASDTLTRISNDFPCSPESMRYFYEILHNAFCDGASGFLPNAVATMCIQVPEELILACEATPLRLCSGAAAYEQLGAEILPAKVCSLVKSSIGMMRILSAEDGERPKLVVVPTTCDQKRKAGEMLAEMGFDVFQLEAPPVKDTEEARFYWQNSVKKLVVQLQKVTGRSLTKKRLKKAIGTLNRAHVEYRRLMRQMELPLVTIYGVDCLLVANASLFDDPVRWTKALSTLNDELEQRKAEKRFVSNWRTPRLLLTGSPPLFPNLKLPILLEQTSAIIVADELCSSSRLLYDSVAYDESNLYEMVPAIADRYLKPCTCPYLASNIDRKRKLLELANKYAVDGVVYQAYSGCNPFEMEQRGIATALLEANIPMLYIETDYSPRDLGQLSTCVEAFVESLKGRKRKE